MGFDQGAAVPLAAQSRKAASVRTSSELAGRLNYSIVRAAGGLHLIWMETTSSELLDVEYLV